MTDKECAGCFTALPKREFLNCLKCKQKYDLKCAGLSKKQFNAMEQAHKNTWKCSGCIDDTQQLNLSSNSDLSDSSTDSIVSNTTLRARSPSSGRQNYVTIARLCEILQRVMSTAMNTTISRLVTSELKSINEKVSSFQEALNFFNAQFESMKISLEHSTSTIANLTKDNEHLKTTVKELTSRLNTVELHMRESNLEINGIPEHRSENLYDTAIQLAKAVDSPLQKEDIQHVTRVAKLSNENNRPRSVIVKLHSPRVRDTVLAAVTKFNKSNPQNKLNSHHLGIGGTQSPVFVSEHLIPAGKYLHAATRKKVKEIGYKFVWVRNGRVFNS
ncbi:uncharacterized protein LOC121729133 [Aricia agestis]|uniref:uncharacterized protein LOC121729133 n=1 Tax=Aricia agestis TaxID=91739 RepID=UPI001C2075EE|nr:uncharacterized protein LOC121729133 [Aricia agestis]